MYGIIDRFSHFSTFCVCFLRDPSRIEARYEPEKMSDMNPLSVWLLTENQFAFIDGQLTRITFISLNSSLNLRDFLLRVQTKLIISLAVCGVQ